MGSQFLRRSFGLVQRASSRSFVNAGSGRRAASSQSRVPDFAFAFDIDGVLLRSSKALPGATKSLDLLRAENIPFLLLTNGGGTHETERMEELSDKLKHDLSLDQIVQSHTPFAELVRGPDEQSALGDKCVLVVGGHADNCRKVAERYGFKKVVTPADVFMANPSIWPYKSDRKMHDFATKSLEPLWGSQEPVDRNDLSRGLKIDAIFVYNDPRDWSLDAQIIIDLLLSSRGVVGTLSEKNGQVGLPNRGFQQDDQPHLYFSNPDLWWPAAYHLPRFGQGGFREALEGIWAAVTGGPNKGVELKKTVIGKPHQGTYEFAENQLLRIRSKMFSEAASPLKNVYMIGDNPESDICGANSYRSAHGTKWHSALVRTGVYNGGKPTWTPTTIEDNVEKAVEWALKNSRWRE